jgi:hypothetical protein
MTSLAAHIAIKPRNVRAVNIETHLDKVDVLHGFSPGAHIVDATRQIIAGLQNGARSRAWSLTGPYGAGKSTYAVFLAALLGDRRHAAHADAAQLLGSVDPQLADLLNLERHRLRLDDRGIVPAVAVARREPTALALTRALLDGAQRATSSRRGRKPAFLHDLSAAVEAAESDPTLVLRAVDDLETIAPVLIVVDELGKTLEYAADGSGEADLYLLQQLAERFSAADGFAGAIVTLQHLAFEDYLVGAGEARRREWRKVHGRFDDVPFVAGRGHGVKLLADAVTLEHPGSAIAKRVRKVAVAAESAVDTAAPHVAPPSAYTGHPSKTYPLHPLTALALPVLASRLGQHDRSLVAFLASDAPTSLRSLLAAMNAESDELPFVRLAHLYDFFFSDGAATELGTGDGLRFREIQARVDDAAHLEPLALEVLKTVAVLNLTAGRDALPASDALIVEAVSGPSDDSGRSAAVRAVLQTLGERGLLTYRDFAGEYRIWQGSDFDITSATAAARERLSLGDVERLTIETIAAAHPLRPVVAQRYSQTHQVLRFFEARFADSKEDLAAVTPKLAGADGLVVRLLASSKPPTRTPRACADGRPLIVLWSPAGAQLRELALDLAAAREVLDNAPELEADAVARREMRYRVSAIRDRLIDAIESGFDPAYGHSVCFVSGRKRKALDTRAFSAVLSKLCEERFPDTPLIANEMVNRRELTSQGAKARRELLERIIEHPDREQLGIEGYGPERAMYEALLRHTGLHDQRHGRWGFGAPPADSPLAAVWANVMDFFDEAVTARREVADLYAQLKAPPFGLKDGPIPVLISVALQHRSDDVFLYQDGTFQPAIDAATVERLLKAPDRFTLKRAALLGLRAAIFEQLRELVDAPARADDSTRNASTLAVVRPLIAFVRDLPEHALLTENLSAHARAVATALREATEPDELLFTQLPAACGLPPIVDVVDGSSQSADFVARLKSALAELGGAYPRLLDQIGELLRAAFASVDEDKVPFREDLRTRCARLTSSVIDPKLRAFLLMASDRDPTETEWLEGIAMSLTAKPPSSWNDRDLVAFEALLAERAGWFRRLEQLYFEMLRHADESFDARKVTITAPDGTEQSEIVPIDKVAQKVAGAALGDVLTELTDKLGQQRAKTALIGALVAHVLTPSPATPSPMSSATPTSASRSA